MSNIQSNIQRILLGFDPLFEFLEQDVPQYPPYNQYKISENEYLLEIAVTGFKPADIFIEVTDHDLVVSAKSSEKIPDSWKALYRGLAQRAFERRFKLGDYVEVQCASIEHGVLAIKLVRNVPEAAKPKTIQISIK